MIREHPAGMNDLQRRLADCFTAVFSSLEQADVSAAAVGSVEGWDSLATVTLIGVVEEAFTIQVPPGDIEQFASFQQAMRYLEGRAG